MNLAFKLSELVQLSAGYPFRGKIEESPASGVRVIQMRDVSNESDINWASLMAVELKGKKKPNWITSGDILFAARGARNYSVLVNTNNQNTVCAAHFYQLKVSRTDLMPEFLVWLLNEKPLQSYFARSAEGSVTKSIRRTVLENAEVVIPPLQKQQEILQLHRVIMREKKLHKELIANSDKLMNAIASELMSGKKT